MPLNAMEPELLAHRKVAAARRRLDVHDRRRADHGRRPVPARAVR
jgi:hypothetical protein